MRLTAMMRLFALLLALCCGASLARACLCLERPLFCEKPPTPGANLNQTIFVGLVVAADPITDFGKDRTIRFRVEETFLGSPGNELVLLGGSGRCCDCSVPFQVGRRYLIDAYRDRRNWSTSACAGTRELIGRRAEAELRALREWQQGKPRTRSLEGQVTDKTERGLPGFRMAPPPAGWTVTLTGPGVRRETVTQTNGGFDFDQTPAAMLRLTLSPPPEWSGVGPLSREVDLTASACMSVHFEVRESQAAVQGRIRREDGRNPRWLPVSALPVGAGITGRSFPTARTNEAGDFTLEALEPGDYLFAIHADATPGSGLVVSYFPGVAEPSQAQRFRLERGQTLTLPDWTLPTR